MARKRLTVLFACFTALPAGMAHGAAPVAPDALSADAASRIELEEVEVTGRGVRRLHYRLVKAQDRFFARYNDLNTRNIFDIHCSYRARTGSQRITRQCQVEFMLNSTAQQGREFTEGVQSGRSSFPVTIPAEDWLRWREEYRENVRQVVQGSPELQKLALKLGELEARYEKALLERRQSAP
jgi:hypothetical protein